MDVLIFYSGNLNIGNGALGAYTIKVALDKATITPIRGIASGILCNFLVCMAILKVFFAKMPLVRLWLLGFQSVPSLPTVLNTLLPICTISQLVSWRQPIRPILPKQKNYTELQPHNYSPCISVVY